MQAGEHAHSKKGEFSMSILIKVLQTQLGSERLRARSCAPGQPGAAVPTKITALLLAVVLVPGLVMAQSFRGSIRGTVYDPSGAVVTKAHVTAHSTATGQSRETDSGGDGGYTFAELPVGTYDVTTQVAGFLRTSNTVEVRVGLDTRCDIKLDVKGSIVDYIVSAQTPLIETTRDVLAQVVDEKLVNELPLNGRDFTKLVALSPGATVEPSGVAGTQFGFGQFNINGNRDRSNNYLLDGTDNNDPYFNNSALNQVGITGAPATLLPIDAIEEFNLQSHFGAEYGRNSGSVVNIITRSGSNQLHGTAFGFLRNSALDARNYFNAEPRKTVFQNSQFGASVGGPVVHDKTFFFGAYEGQRENNGSDFRISVPTAAKIAQAQAVALGTGQISQINPALTKILDFYPTSTTGTIDSAVRDKNNLDGFIAKIDHNFSHNELLTGRYAFGKSYQIFPLGLNGGFGKGSRLAPFSQTSPTRTQLVSLSLLSTLSSNKVNEIRFGYSRYRTSFSSLDANFDPATLGLNLGTGKLGLPEFDFNTPSLENLGATGFSVPRGRTSQTFQYLDNFTWVKGKHTVKLGGEFRRAAVENFNDNLERSIFFYSPDPSVIPACQPVNKPVFCNDPVVLSLTNFYLGANNFGSALTGDTHRTTYNNGLAFFAQDDLRVANKLTLNLGVRWEYFGPLSEKHNLLSNLGKDGLLAMVGTDGLNGEYERDLNNFAPRFGFAWNARSKTVVRGGYGFYYDYVPQDLFIASFTSSAGIATNPIGPKPVLPLSFDQNAFNGSSPGVPIYTPITSGPYNVFVTPRKFPTPYVQNWNLNVQQKLAQNTSLEIGYVGSKGTKLVRLFDANQPDGSGNRSNSNFNTVDTLAPISKSVYHALQTTLRLQSQHGFSGFATYTWGKSLDDASDGIDFTSGVAFPQDSTNLRAERGPSTFDTRHRFTAALNYDLPEWRAVGKFGSGWQLNWIASVQSGRPIPIVTSNDNSGRFYFNQRPDRNPAVNPVLSHWNPVSGYLNPNAFLQPADGAFGNLGRNSVFGPGYRNLDFSITKNTQIVERLKLQFGRSSSMCSTIRISRCRTGR